MSFAPFQAATDQVDAFLQLLSDLGIDLKHGEQAEEDALAMTRVLEYWKFGTGSSILDPRPLLRDAIGFVDIASRILAVKDHDDFGQLYAHLRQLGTTSILQNRKSSAADQAANKVIELYVACVAMKFAKNVRLDHPDRSRGDNPDVMFDYRGKCWALAIKTLHSTAPRTIFENIKKAAAQIDASPADHGLVVINLKNVISHEDLWPHNATPITFEVALALLMDQMKAIAASLKDVPSDEWRDAFGPSCKATLPVLYVAHGTAYVVPPQNGRAHPTQLKVLMTDREFTEDSVGAFKLAQTLAHYMQGLL